MKLLTKMSDKIMPSANKNNNDAMQDIKSIYQIHINSLQGEPLLLDRFEGKHMLFVNVASKCGFTGQYKGLQELYDIYKDRLEIIGVPCNQFGSQEPGNADSIKSFCERNYGVSFTMTEKIKVKGAQQHPMYTWLTHKKHNQIKSSSVKWNFQKYLVNQKGELVDVFYSITKPTSSKITKHLK